MTEALPHLWDQDYIVLGEFNADVQSHNPRNQQVDKLLVEFGLVYLRHHLGSAGGSDTKNMVSDEARKIVAERFEYIYGTEGRRVDMAGIKDRRNYASEHFARRDRILQPGVINRMFLGASFYYS